MRCYQSTTLMPDTKSLKGRGSPHPVRSGTAGPLRANLGTLMTQRYGVDEERLAQITCYRANARITVDGDLSKPAWRDVPRSSRFVDMVSGEPALYDTRVACQWDQERFYVAYWIEEPQVKATLTERDSFIWNDNDVELFVGGDDCYYELEINAFGTVYEAFFVWQDSLRRGSRFDRAGFDPMSRNVDPPGGFPDASRHGKHPPGPRPGGAPAPPGGAAAGAGAATGSPRAAAASRSSTSISPGSRPPCAWTGRSTTRPRSTAAGASRWRCRGGGPPSLLAAPP